ncbi:Katanin p80 WD40 repeat-containing subunit B1-like [Glycine soja]|uniref:Katanin p80 WD40 repeat-containing subunit B1-like n=1 Tax=Glycine soja TaxID=3848 RepID=A0A445JKG7_GLYSO|nr:Katanin p80 WD40 repeat-containing subunit B1-like [Glycine soja]
MQSLCGHTSSIEAVTFDSAEVLILSGASSGVIKLSDLEEAKNSRVHFWREKSSKYFTENSILEKFIFGSADRTMKFWDLETFELIGSTRHEVSRVRSIAFHPDGQILFAGFEDSLKLIEPYNGSLETEKKESTKQKLSLQGRQMEKVEAGVGPAFGLCSMSVDNESKEIKNIYI